MTTRIGIVGLGRQGQRHSRAFLEAEDTTLVAYTDVARRPELERAFGIRWEPSLAVMCSASFPVDVIVVSTPTGTHEAPIRAALAAGKHVLADKPAVLRLRTLQELSALAITTGAWLCCHFSRRHDPHMVIAAKYSRILDEPISLVLDYADGYQGNDMRESRAAWKLEGVGSGILYDWGPHLIDQALDMFAAEGDPVRIQAWGSAPFGFVDRPHGEVITIRVEWPSGQSALLLASWLSYASGLRMRLDCRNGSVLTDSYQADILLRSPSTPKRERLPMPSNGESIVALLRTQLSYSESRSHEQRRLYLVTKLLEAAEMSAASGGAEIRWA